MTGKYFDEKCQAVKVYEPTYDRAVWKQPWYVSVEA